MWPALEQSLCISYRGGYMVLGVAAVGLLKDRVCGNVGSVEISWACCLPICSSHWCDIHMSLPKLGAVTQSYSCFYECEYVLCPICCKSLNFFFDFTICYIQEIV